MFSPPLPYYSDDSESKSNISYIEYRKRKNSDIIHYTAKSKALQNIPQTTRKYQEEGPATEERRKEFITKQYYDNHYAYSTSERQPGRNRDTEWSIIITHNFSIWREKEPEMKPNLYPNKKNHKKYWNEYFLQFYQVEHTSVMPLYVRKDTPSNDQY